MDPKHDRYAEVHCPGDEFWGIGIENETYIELMDGFPTTVEFLLKNHVRERYSVNYWNQYKEGRVNSALHAWAKAKFETPITLPLLLNGHTLSKCDRFGEHKSVFSSVPKPNPKFSKTTLFEDLSGSNPVIFGEESNGKWWTFDGDTVEFMTQDYYCAKVENVVAELKTSKAKWMDALREGLNTIPRKEKFLQQPVGWPRANYGFAVFLSNRRNLAIFNNGTYHFNLTAPTRLDKDGNIQNWDLFVKTHQKIARLFQWISPFLVAKFGSADPMANLSSSFYNTQFPAGSQRLAASRYVSVGTYDTRIMERGKLLTKPKEEVLRRWWESMYKDVRCAYTSLESIGFDINFNKFKNHGLEFRIFDWFPESELEGVLRLFVWMMDAALLAKEVPFPQELEEWNEVLRKCVWNGTSTLLTSRELEVFRSVLGISTIYPDKSNTLSVLDVYDRIYRYYANHYDGIGVCSRKMIAKPLFRPMPCRICRMREKIPIRRIQHSDVIRITLLKKIRLRQVEMLPPPPVVVPPLSPPPPKQQFCTFESREPDPLNPYISNEETHLHHIQCLPLQIPRWIRRMFRKK